MQRVKRSISAWHSRWFLALIVCVAVYAVYFTTLTLLRHDNLHSLRLDLGNMDQTVWNVANGHGFTLTDPMGEGQQSRLAVHADFLLILLAPFYSLWSGPQTLLVIQSVVLAAGAIPVFFLALEIVGVQWLAFVFGVSYLLYPPLQRANLYDFHAVTLATSFLLWAFWCMRRGKYAWFAVFALLAAITKEQVWLVTGLMGVWIAVVGRRWVLGGVFAAVNFAMFYLLFWKFIPEANASGTHFAIAYLSDYGGSQGDIVKSILTNPLKIIETIVLPDRLYYLFQLFLPVGFLNLLSPVTMLFTVPSLLINLLSNNGLMRRVDFQYDTVITPFIIVAAIEGMGVLRRFLLRVRIIPVVWFVGWVVFATYMWGELPHMKNSRFFTFISPQAEREAVLALEQEVDSRYSVSVTNNIGSHFSQRQYLWNFPVKATEADYTLVKLSDPNAWPSNEEQKAAMDALLTNPRYTLVAHDGTFWAFKKTGL